MSIDPKMIEALPQSVLDTTPAGPPPPGVVPDLAHPVSVRTETIVVCTIFIAIAILFFAVRVYVKLRIVRATAIDDYLCFIGLLFTLAEYSGVVLSCTGGAGGQHIWDSTLAEYFSHANLISNWMTVVFVTPALGFVKLSFFFQYYSLFWPLPWVRWASWIGGVTAGLFYFSITITMFAIASPRNGESWVATFLSQHYLDANKLSIPTGTVGAAVDLFLLVLPVRAVMTLEIARAKKLGLIAVFATGSLAAVSSIVGLAYRVKTTQHFMDAEWWVTKVFLWLIIELSAGVSCSCMPSASKLLHSHATAKSTGSYANGSSSRGQGSRYATTKAAHGGISHGEWHSLHDVQHPDRKDPRRFDDEHIIKAAREIEVTEERIREPRDPRLAPGW